MKNSLLFISALVATLAASAHEGHYLPGAAHWHATDVFGYVVLAIAVAGAAWWLGKK